MDADAILDHERVDAYDFLKPPNDKKYIMVLLLEELCGSLNMAILNLSSRVSLLVGDGDA